MKRSIILSTVAATVVTGVLMMSGCNSSAPKAATPEFTGEGHVAVTITDGKISDSVVTIESTPTAGAQASVLKSSVTVRSITECVDTNGDEAACSTVCTPVAPCEVKLETACSSSLNYSNTTDESGAWSLYNVSADADVAADRADTTTYPTFSGTTTISQSGGIGSCGFDFSTFIVCAITKDGDHYWNTTTNSAGYVMVLIEYADDTKEWKKVDVARKSNGFENGQPFIELTGLDGKVPAKITVFSILKVGAAPTGTTGSTGTTGAGD